MTNQRCMDPILLIGSIIVLAAMLTWLLPAGRFDRTHDSLTGQTVVVPGSFKLVPRNPVYPWGALMSIPQGLAETAEVVFFVLLAGAAISVVEATGAISNFLNHLMRRFCGSPIHSSSVSARRLRSCRCSPGSLSVRCFSFWRCRSGEDTWHGGPNGCRVTMWTRRPKMPLRRRPA